MHRYARTSCHNHHRNAASTPSPNVTAHLPRIEGRPLRKSVKRPRPTLRTRCAPDPGMPGSTTAQRRGKTKTTAQRAPRLNSPRSANSTRHRTTRPEATHPLRRPAQSLASSPQAGRHSTGTGVPVPWKRSLTFGQQTCDLAGTGMPGDRYAPDPPLPQAPPGRSLCPRHTTTSSQCSRP